MTCFICRTQQVSKLSEDLYGMELHKKNWFLSVQRQGHSNLLQLFDCYLDWKKVFTANIQKPYLSLCFFKDFSSANSIKKDLLDQDIFIKILYCLLYSFILVYKVPKCYWIKSRQVVKRKLYLSQTNSSMRMTYLSRCGLRW